MAKQTLTTIKDEHFGIARKIVSNMTAESWETIPHCCATYDAEVTEFMRVLKEINSTISKEEKITVNTAMLRVIVEAIKACPQVNSHIYFNHASLHCKDVTGLLLFICCKTYSYFLLIQNK